MISENLFLLTSDAQVEILHPRGAAGKSTLGHCLLPCENVCVLMTWRAHIATGWAKGITIASSYSTCIVSRIFKAQVVRPLTFPESLK